VVANDFGTIDMDEASVGNEWNSGETLAVTLFDQDLNKNSAEAETVVGSSLIRWNIGEVQWLEASYPASGTGVVRTIDPGTLERELKVSEIAEKEANETSLLRQDCLWRS
jgi:hypothetical protein